jgi:SAM-dependent methyltransferase
MADNVRTFYDELAASYHLIYADWDASVRRQGQALDRIVREALGDGSWSILDAACGIGTQAIGLALAGHRVRGTDLSPAAVTRAADEARRWDVALDLGVADLRHLDQHVEGTFDVVIACDNALPHLLTDAELHQAAAGIRAKLRPGGLFIGSTRDYDAIVLERPRATSPQVVDDSAGRRISFQVWDWSADGRTYELNLFLVRQQADGWHTDSYSATYRALQRSELTATLEAAGFADVRWRMPPESGFFQPIVLARRGGDRRTQLTL